jgi:hypothetical protein
LEGAGCTRGTGEIPDDGTATEVSESVGFGIECDMGATLDGIKGLVEIIVGSGTGENMAEEQRVVLL